MGNAILRAMSAHSLREIVSESEAPRWRISSDDSRLVRHQMAQWNGESGERPHFVLTPSPLIA